MPGAAAHFCYTGSCTAANGKWRNELTTLQHAKPAGVLPLFGGREVTSGSAASIPIMVRWSTARGWQDQRAVRGPLKFREAL